MFSEDRLRPISALQHLVFCARQCALIHLEGAWADNPLTVEGTHLHERVDSPQRREVRGDVVIVRGLQLRSLQLGLVGRADVVELHRDQDGARVPDLPGQWRMFPVEYKRGKPKADHCDEVQLCAQALCLEEMLDTEIPQGALFYGARKRRHLVALDDRLRRVTATAVVSLHQLLDQGATPPAEHGARCRKCSLEEICLPAVNQRPSARGWLKSWVTRESADGGNGDGGNGDRGEVGV